MNYTSFFLYMLVLKICCAFRNDKKLIINRTFDQNLNRIRDVIREYDLDPVKLQNLSTEFNVTVTFFNQLVKLNLTNGELYGVSTMKRADSIYLTAHPNTVRIHGLLKFEELKEKFNYSYSAGFYSDKGEIDSTITNLTVRVTVDLKLLELVLANPRIKVEDYGNLDLTMTSVALFSPITNILVNYASPDYKNDILNLANQIAEDILQQIVKKINKHFIQIVVGALANLIEDTVTGRLINPFLDLITNVSNKILNIKRNIKLKC